MFSRIMLSSVLLAFMLMPWPASSMISKQTFEGFLHSAVPDLDAQYGIKRLRFINRTSYSGWTDDTALPPAAWYNNVAAGYTNPHNYLLIDIESWPVSTQAERLATSDKFATVYAELKSRRPDLQIGFYAYPTIRDLFNAILPHGDANYLAWQAKNNDFATIWAVVDIVFPSIYWFYNTALDGPGANNNSHLYFHENIGEAIRCRTTFGHNQPIVPYVTFDAVSHASGNLVDPIVWDDMVRTAYLEADGLILWGGFTETWSNGNPWWINFTALWPFGDRELVKPRVVAAPRTLAGARMQAGTRSAR